MKMKILVCSREDNMRTRIKLKEYKIIEQVDDFKYLGSTFSLDEICKKRNGKENMPGQDAIQSKKKYFYLKK